MSDVATHESARRRLLAAIARRQAAGTWPTDCLPLEAANENKPNSEDGGAA